MLTARPENATLLQNVVASGVGVAVVGGKVAVGAGLADGAAVGADVPQSFSYQATVLSCSDADSPSRSPSPSTSMA